MKFKFLALLFCATVLASGSLLAGTLFNVNGTVGTDSESGSVFFTMSNCDASGCQLDILITNNVGSPANESYGISGLSFNIGSLTSAGSLKTSSGSAYVTDGNGGTVNSVAFGATATVTATNAAPRWSFAYNNSDTGCPVSTFCLSPMNGGTPNEFILGSGPYTGYNASLVNKSPGLGGPIDFEIDNFAGLAADSTFTNVVVNFGGESSSLTAVDPAPLLAPIPEPGTMGIMGLGLVGLGAITVRRRKK
jgi:hypothetical protein